MPKPPAQKGVTSSSDVAEKMCRKLAPTTLKREARERQVCGILLRTSAQLRAKLHFFAITQLWLLCTALHLSWFSLNKIEVKHGNDPFFFLNSPHNQDLFLLNQN